MAREIHRLTARQVQTAKRPGRYADGGGLYLRVAASGSKAWEFRYRSGGRGRYMGLGSMRAVSLAKAREKAAACRTMLADGKDPIDARATAKAEERASQREQSRTFKDCALACIASMEVAWRNEKHRQQWYSTLETYVYPIIGDMPVGDVAVEDVLEVLNKIWTAKPETASRVRQRIERVLDYATACEYRTGENPARWKGRLDAVLPPSKKVARVKHHPAMPYEDVGAFMARLAGAPSPSSLALRFLVLTGVRTSEALGARWLEIDESTETWTIPAERMKAGREHVVPLCNEALDVLRVAREISQGGFIFPGAREGRPLSNMALLMLMRGMGLGHFVPHGFRSTFRDWAAETTNFPNHVCEMALGHQIGDKVEAAYRRGDLLEKRRRLMEAWGHYATTPQETRGQIVTLSRGTTGKQ